MQLKIPPLPSSQHNNTTAVQETLVSPADSIQDSKHLLMQYSFNYITDLRSSTNFRDELMAVGLCSKEADCMTTTRHLIQFSIIRNNHKVLSSGNSWCASLANLQSIHLITGRGGVTDSLGCKWRFGKL